MKDIFQTIKTLLTRREPSVLVIIIASSGSTPRRAGSKMLVGSAGRIAGSIGGGAVEYKAIETAQENIRRQSSCIKEFSLTRAQAAEIGMVCGGDVKLFFQYISPERKGMDSLCQEILAALKERRKSWLLWELAGEEWKLTLEDFPHREECKSHTAAAKQHDEGKVRGPAAGQENRVALWQSGGKLYFQDPLVLPGRVYIFGGGHVAQELVPLLSHLGFSCIVMDDRKEFANQEVFPQAEQTIVGDLEHITDYVTIGCWDYVCIMTRGHQYDYYVQRQAMSLHPCYIGVMGSRNKIQVVSGKLMEDGFSREEIERCHMPIGTRISAETPAEIAVSIAGELILARAEQTGVKKA